MSSAVRVFPSPALDQRKLGNIEGVFPASRLGVRPQPQTILTGIPQVDEVTGGIPRGGLTEIFGPVSSGRTSLLLSLISQITSREEVCALVDVSDAFDPQSATAAGIDLQRVLWVRCGGEGSRSSFRVSRQKRSSYEKRETRNAKLASLEQGLRSLDLLLQAGGFGLLVIDLGDVPAAMTRRVPLTSWFRFRRAVENTVTAMVVVEQEASAKSCASLVLKTRQSAFSTQYSAKATGLKRSHTRLLHEMQLQVEVLNSRFFECKSVRSATASFQSQATWVG
jgi:hypothetical protein